MAKIKAINSKKYFDRVADQWDSMRKSFFSEKVREKAFETAGVISGKLAADIGAGIGFITEGLVRKGARIIAVDQSENMLKEMRKRFLKFSKIDYRLGTAEKIPIPDRTVDYVFANMVLHHVDSPSDVIKEMTRILKSGGKLVITDLDEHNFEFLRTEHHDRWMGFKRDDVRKWLIDAGLSDARIDCVGENCCATSSCGCQNTSISIFIAFGQKK